CRYTVAREMDKTSAAPSGVGPAKKCSFTTAAEQGSLAARRVTASSMARIVSDRGPLPRAVAQVRLSLTERRLGLLPGRTLDAIRTWVLRDGTFRAHPDTRI